jgi:ribonuclease Z
MRYSFHHGLVNGPLEDPCLYVRLPEQKRAFLFDAGDISRLSPGDLTKITDVFVTHTHIDHFIGFDTVMRVLLRSERPLSVYGPADIIQNVEGKLKGYSWNKIKYYPLRIEVFGISDGSVHQSSFYAENRFERQDRGDREFNGTVLSDGTFKVKAAILEHDIQCLAYSMEEDFHINIDKAALESLGLPVGPWLSELKRTIRGRMSDETEIEVSGKRYTLKELRPITRITEGQKISYVTDVSPEEKNVQEIVRLSGGSDTLYCEACFMEADRDRALERNHLTAKIAGRIAREAGVKKLVAMHFSPRYRNSPEAPEKEAMDEFQRPSSSS